MIPLDISDLAQSSLKSLKIDMDEVCNKDMMFIMEGSNLTKFDLEEINLTGKHTLDMFMHFIAGKPPKLRKL
jgi:hypothetical protein